MATQTLPQSPPPPAPATTTTAAGRDVTGSFNYYASDAPPALDDVAIFNDNHPGIARRTQTVTDLRGGGGGGAGGPKSSLDTYTHETHGFQVLRQPLPRAVSASPSDPAVMRGEGGYYASVLHLLRDALGCRSAAVVNSTLRDMPRRGADRPIDARNPRADAAGSSMAPFFIAHSDYTPAAARAHLRAMDPATWFAATGTEACTTETERAEFLRLRAEVIAAEDRAIRARGLDPDAAHDAHDAAHGAAAGQWAWDGTGYDGPRYAMFSVWRPLETVRRDPLAVLDMARSRFAHAVLPRMYRDRPGCVPAYYNENVLVRPPPPSSDEGESHEEHHHHHWVYLSEQRPDEVLALKFYDSEALRSPERGIKGMCPHSAFSLEGTDHLPPRRSCELRVWCIW